MHTGLPCALQVCKELAVSLSLPSEILQMSKPLAKQGRVAQNGTALNKDTAVLLIAVSPIVSKSNVMHCRVTWCSSATLADNVQT